MKRIYTAILLLLCAASLISAQSLTVDAQRVVSVGETFKVVFTANGSLEDFEWPESEHFTKLWGPQTGSMSSVSIVNGRRTSSHQETMTYILQANAPGKFTLPAATGTVEGKKCSSGSFSIEVVGDEPVSQQDASQAQASSSQQSGSQQAQAQQSAPVRASGKDIFLSLSLNKSRVVKGEPLTATLKLYTRVDIRGFEDVRFPTFDGFWSKETVSPQNIEFNRENVGGTIYNSALIRKYMLIPQRTGNVVIDPAEMICQVVESGSSSSNSIFDSFFDTYQVVRKRLTTSKITLNVSPLPSGAPASFTGGVGDFKMDVKLGNGQLKSNEASSLIVTVSGRGNVSMIETPEIGFPQDFEVYDAKVTEDVSADGLSGTKTFEYPFIPRSHGEFRMDPVKFSYYDINKGRYVELASEPFVFKVEKGDVQDGGGQIQAGFSQRDVKNIASDIRFIVTGDSGLRKKGEFFAGSVLFWILMVVAALLFFALSAVIRAMSARRLDVAGTRNRRAKRMAKARLRLAGDYLKKSLNSAYYEELHKAVMGYVSDKLAIPSADLSKDRISETLASYGVETSLTDRLLHIIDACEFARYAPDTAQAEKEDLYNESLNVISELEDKVKKNISKKNVKAVVALIAILLSAGLQSFAQDFGKMWKEAGEQYTAGEYASALDNYSAIESQGMVSDDLYYNIANCHFRTGDNARAILYYEKCLKLNPSHKDAQHNLEIAKSFTADKIDMVPEFILLTWLRNLEYSFSPDGWAWISLAIALVTVVLLLVFRFASSVRLRKVSFIFACIFFVLAVCGMLFSLDEKSEAMAEDTAIVMESPVSVMSSPGDTGRTIFVLHEGTKVEVLDALKEWYQIELSDGRQGWVEQSSVEMI